MAHCPAYKLYVCLLKCNILMISVMFNSVFMILNAMSICVTVLVLNLHHRQSGNDVPKWLERFWLQKNGSQVQALTLKMTEEVTPEDDAESSSDTPKNDGATYAVLSSILDEMKKVTDHMTNTVNKEEMMRLKWRVIAEAVNSVLCAVYISAGVVTSITCVVLWYLG